MSKLGISLVINTKNEEKNIVECIKSAKGLVAEVLVADMNSQDQTVDLAKSAGARVIKVEDYDYVEPARNEAINEAKSEWILILDADERLNKKLLTTLAKTASEDKFDVLKIPRKNIIFEKWIKHSHYWPDYQVRFFKKGFVEWSNVMHSQPKIEGRAGELPAKEDNAIIHHHYNNIHQWLLRTERYTGKSTFFDNQENITIELINRYTKGEFIWRLYETEGYKDSTHGFVLSRLMEFYRFLEFVKFWERNNYQDYFSPDEVYRSSDNASEMKAEIDDLKRQLEVIKSSNFFKIWQRYCNLRDNLKNKGK